MQDAKTLSLRVPLDMAHALEDRLQLIRNLRAPGDSPPRGQTDWKVSNISDLVRECIAVGLRVHARDPELMADLCAETFADEIKAALALGVSNPAALRMLKKVAASIPVEPDFG